MDQSPTRKQLSQAASIARYLKRQRRERTMVCDSSPLADSLMRDHDNAFHDSVDQSEVDDYLEDGSFHFDPGHVLPYLKFNLQEERKLGYYDEQGFYVSQKETDGGWEELITSVMANATPEQQHAFENLFQMTRATIVVDWIQQRNDKQLKGLDTVAAQFSQHPLIRCKILHLVRHAEGLQEDPDSLLPASARVVDSQVSNLGWQQIGDLRKFFHESGMVKRVELVVTSPFLRTIQTAIGVFGSDGHTNITVTPPIIAAELCRERLGLQPCDKRRSISEYQSLFPEIDFSSIEEDQDKLWEADIRETNEDVGARGKRFMKWLWTRDEKEIAVVSHGGFLEQTLIALENDCDHSCKSELGKWFGGCEVRSMVVIDRKLPK